MERQRNLFRFRLSLSLLSASTKRFVYWRAAVERSSAAPRPNARALSRAFKTTFTAHELNRTRVLNTNDNVHIARTAVRERCDLVCVVCSQSERSR